MAGNIPYEFTKFNRNCRYLRRILKETQHSLDEIRKSGNIYEEQLPEAHLTESEIQQIHEILDKPPCIFVLGQSCYAKSTVVNNLFGKPVLPTLSPAEDDQCWRAVHFKYGLTNQLSLALPNSYELLENLPESENTWSTIPMADLTLGSVGVEGRIHGLDSSVSAPLEIMLRHPLLKENVQVLVTPSDENINDIIERWFKPFRAIVLYSISETSLSSHDIEVLKNLRLFNAQLPVYFIKVCTHSQDELTESEQHALGDMNAWRQQRSGSSDSARNAATFNIFQQLCDLDYLSILPSEGPKIKKEGNSFRVESEFVEHFEYFANVLFFVRHMLQLSTVIVATILYSTHMRCLRMFINTAFEMARDMLITPRRIEYARQKESELYSTLMDIANKKQEEIKELIVETTASLQDHLLESAAVYQFKDVEVPENGVLSSGSDLKQCTGEIQDLVLGALNTAVAEKLVGSVECLRENYLGTLERCLQNLEASLCHDGESPQASAALRQILNAAYQVEVTIKTSATIMRMLWEKMKQLVQTMPWKTPPRIDGEWKRKVAAEMMGSLSEWRLARSICSQFRERLKTSHDDFLASLKHLEALHSGRLEKTEEQRYKVRKLHAPRIARYALEAASIRDVVLYGMPVMGREIGRGQYGVVYACDQWAGFSPCAIKSVVPPDEKHWNDLALEFHYTRSVPEHERVVSLRGSVIDHSYSGGTSAAVLLIMDRFQRDLYSAIKSGLDWPSRLQVAIDVVQGIRFLHSQGLVHRDIKLKNVLLDRRNRAKITDLGFCKPEAMMSGSIVGTPIHMAPELFSGRYDSSVDVYAFGIMFWYICAGHVRLPYVYEQCQNKDQLWTAVKRGARPERLPQFDEECWTIMESCWMADPIHRPLLGDIEPRLEALLHHYRYHPAPSQELLQKERTFSLSSSPYIDVEFYPA